MAEFSKSLDVNLAGVSTAGVPASNADVGALNRAQRIMDALEGVKRLGDACERLSRRMDASHSSTDCRICQTREGKEGRRETGAQRASLRGERPRRR